MEKRALRYQTNVHETVDKDAALYKDALDETGTVNTECMTDYDDDSIGERENTTLQQHTGIEGINDGVL